ncbi:alpha/beta fold hydrolase [Curvibacter sp. HBC61]|uniref:Alpha/beta fold hydrolase n=1 Tax=Curvibacter cyanobacteriorum TaxID=3026422 RepID=A0ABT5N1N5_9BURK|nr:alpha/beta hydrolase [Curvibacter sp. HBC61]MDD0839576.1 alpha/beta fold hydrolase [Curvibacter sp. HBC61]
MNPSDILILPGWQNSGPAHWQSRWEAQWAYHRVQQHDWQRPLRGDWNIQLEEAVLARSGPVLLVAHSLGCVLVAAWAAHSRNTHRVAGALLVAPPDLERDDLRPLLPSWTPIERRRLPFRSTLVASSNDPYAAEAHAQALAQAWGSEYVAAGPAGHLNADSGLGDWPAGQALLRALMPA